MGGREFRFFVEGPSIQSYVLSGSYLLYYFYRSSLLFMCKLGEGVGGVCYSALDMPAHSSANICAVTCYSVRSHFVLWNSTWPVVSVALSRLKYIFHCIQAGSEY